MDHYFRSHWVGAHTYTSRSLELLPGGSGDLHTVLYFTNEVTGFVLRTAPKYKFIQKKKRTYVYFADIKKNMRRDVILQRQRTEEHRLHTQKAESAFCPNVGTKITGWRSVAASQHSSSQEASNTPRREAYARAPAARSSLP